MESVISSPRPKQMGRQEQKEFLKQLDMVSESPVRSDYVIPDSGTMAMNTQQLITEERDKDMTPNDNKNQCLRSLEKFEKKESLIKIADNGEHLKVPSIQPIQR